VELLAGKLRARGFTVTYDHEVLANPGAYDATEVEWMSLAPEGSARGDELARTAEADHRRV
jgi:hypothetical protein